MDHHRIPRFSARAASIFISVWLLVGAVSVLAQDTGPTLLLRYDDMTAASPFPIEKALVEGTAALGGFTMVGIVPAPGGEPSPLPPNKSLWLKRMEKAGYCVLAQHGYTHANHSGNGEFAGKPVEAQHRLIRAGKQILQRQGLNPSWFVPPFNLFDRDTVLAAEREGFVGLSAGLQAWKPSWGGGGGLRFLPGYFHPAHVVDWANGTPGPRGGLIVVVAHPYDFVGGGEMPQFRKGARQVSVASFLRALARLRSRGWRIAGESLLEQADLSAERYSWNVRYWHAQNAERRFLPALLRSPGPWSYLGVSDAKRRVAAIVSKIASLYGFIALGGLWAGHRAWAAFAKKGRIAVFALGGAALVTVAARTVSAEMIYLKGAVVGVAAGSLMVGALCGILRRAAQRGRAH